ncbi:Uncharacterized protein dnl_30460 [Desulfonema limicola]|uniref:Uncharacterized protein n=1 Tax=Desulfonema limicola TaxID=45656 RepID=A0A975B8E1_9BACT|nr:Uncharacterized protein dnl_30460 [Desulfonema limicola]
MESNLFQSLFSWKYNCESRSPPSSLIRVWFQSLFSWKYNCEIVAVVGVLSVPICFNPCFHGSTTVRLMVGTALAAAIKFQSLFSWKYNCEYIVKDLYYTTKRRFNPCFHGSTTVRPTKTEDPKPVECFNPCFHGSTTVRYSGLLRKNRPGRFQSLFSWKYNCESLTIRP